MGAHPFPLPPPESPPRWWQLRRRALAWLDRRIDARIDVAVGTESEAELVKLLTQTPPWYPDRLSRSRGGPRRGPESAVSPTAPVHPQKAARGER